MKKLVSVLLAAVMTLCLAASVLAAPSAGSGMKPLDGTITGPNGQETISPDDLDAYVIPVDTQRPGSLGAFQIVLNGADSLTVRVYVPGANPGDEIFVYFPDGYFYAVIVGEDGTITIEITEETTIEFVLKNQAPVQPEPNGNGQGGAGTSPQTGETNAYPFACVMAVIFACAALFAGRKAVR